MANAVGASTLSFWVPSPKSFSHKKGAFRVDVLTHFFIELSNQDINTPPVVNKQVHFAPTSRCHMWIMGIAWGKLLNIWEFIIPASARLSGELKTSVAGEQECNIGRVEYRRSKFRLRTFRFQPFRLLVPKSLKPCLRFLYAL